jgi:hypothetical protein
MKNSSLILYKFSSNIITSYSGTQEFNFVTLKFNAGLVNQIHSRVVTTLWFYEAKYE